jgi:transposase
LIFIDFIKSIIYKLKENKVLFMDLSINNMDNARIHHSKLFKEYIKAIKNDVIYNVPYCSELNPIELVFSKVKLIVNQRDNNEDPNNLQKT